MAGSGNHLRKVARLLSSRGAESSDSGPLPSQEAVAGLLESAKLLLFPNLLIGHTRDLDEGLEEVLTSFHGELRRQVERAFAGRSPLEPSATAERVCQRFVERLPDLQALLESDVQAALDGDPSLHTTDEAVLCYPGIAAVICFRLAHELQVQEVPLIPRMLTEQAHSRTGIDIHPAAQIGERFFIDHGTGVVIGATAVIGSRVRFYQGVTLGARSFPTDEKGRLLKGIARHPIVQDDVVVYSGASILGRVTIGHGSVIGGNVWVTHDVPPHSVVTQARHQQTEFSDGAGI